MQFLETAVNARPNIRIEVIDGVRVIVPDRARFLEKLNLLAKDGKEKLLVVSDFDFTISRFHTKEGVRANSCHKVLEDCGLLGPEYETKGQAVQKKYYGHEVDPNLDEATRHMYMEEWVHKSHALLLDFHLTRTLLKKAVRLAIDREVMILRPHLQEFFGLLKAEQVPLLIFSAGIADVLEEVLHQHAIISQPTDQDVTVISNRCIFADDDKEGIVVAAINVDREAVPPPVETPTDLLVGFHEPLINVFNKKSSAFVDNHPFFQRADIKTKQNLMLLGDSLGDLAMNEGMTVPDHRILRVGFLNDKVIERLDAYLASGFDILMFDDPGFEVPIRILQNIAHQRVDILE